MQTRTLAVLAGALALCAMPRAHAVGRSIDVQVVDRSTGETLAPIFHDGLWWIAGRPGARYGVTLVNRSGRRTLNVIAIDGVNAVSGDTAAWNQTGYVLDAYQSTRIDGWRKNVDQVAAFEFTARPDSYAARTGRAANVGVIGVATFNEPKPAPIARSRIAPEPSRAADASASTPLPAPSGNEASAGRSDSPKVASAPRQRDRLGTGHGELEASSIRYVSFERAQNEPDEIVTIHYDRIENLIAMGIVSRPSMPPVATRTTPNPFPDSGRFVADPPPR